jgi:hypothetical protein
MAEKIVIPIEVQGSKAVKDINKVNDALDNTGKAAEGSKKGFGSLAGLLKGGLGIGAVMSLLDGLGGALMKNQKVQDLMNKAMVVFQGIVNGVIEVLDPLFVALNKVFKDPVKALKEFGEMIKTNITNRFEGLLEYIPQVGKAIGLLLKGEFSEAAKTATNAVGKIVLGVNDTVGLVKDGMDALGKAAKTIADETKNAAKNADAYVDAEKKLAKLEIAMQGVIETYDRQAEVLRQVRDDETKTIEERIKANDDLKKKLEEGQAAEIANLNEQIKQKRVLLSVDKNNVQLQNDILRLEADKQGVLAKTTGIQSEQQQNKIALDKESIEMTKALAEGVIEANRIIADSNAEMIKEGAEQFDAKQKAIDDEYQAQLKLNDEEIKRHKEGTAAYVEAVNAKLLLDAQYTADTQANTKARADFDAAATEEAKQLAKERADYEIEQAKMVAENQMSAVMGALTGVQSLVGENSKFGKALAVSMAIIDTYSGATKALAQGGTFGFIGAAGVIASGLANVRAIMQQELPGVEGGSGGGGGVSMSAPSGPNVGIISGQINSSAQLLGSLNNSLSTPPRAYVVGQDVNSQQSLDRHIRQNATL